jgi:hypothetical protein
MHEGDGALVPEFGSTSPGDFALVETPKKQSQKAGFVGAGAEGIILTVDIFLDGDFNTALYGHEISVNGGELLKGLFIRTCSVLKDALLSL